MRHAKENPKHLAFIKKYISLQPQKDKVPWMSGLVSGLQNHVRRFESARYLGFKTAMC